VVAVERGRLQREVTALGALKAVKATAILVPADPPVSRKIAAIVPNGEFVRQGQTIAVFDALEANRQLADGEADFVRAENRILSARATGTKTRQDLESDRQRVQEDRERAQDVAPMEAGIFSRHEIIESAVDRALLDKRAAIAGQKLDAGDSLNRADVALGRVERDKAGIAIRQARSALGALEVKAPHDGLVVLSTWRGEVLSLGQQVWPGQRIGELPDLSALEARVYILEADADGLATDRRATVAIEGRPGAVFPARVTRVDSIAKPQSQQRGSPVKYFEAILSFERQDARLMKPGQRVKARIVLEQLDGVLTIPRGALFEKDGQRVVYRLEGERFRPVEVVVGHASPARVVIERGLEAGDRVALRDPTRALSDILKARSAAQGGTGAQGRE
jgi:HlyD family secretion protein